MTDEQTAFLLINARRDGDVAVVTFRGANAMFEGDKVENVTLELFDLIEVSPTKKFLLDLGNIYYMSSAMLAQLVRIQRAVQTKKGRLRLCSPRPAIQEAFRVSRFDKFFEIFRDVPSAMKKF